MVHVLVLVGSLRDDSVNRKVGQIAVDASSADVSAQIYPRLADLPHFNQNFEDNPPLPEAVEHFKSAVAEADAVLLVTPAYNGGLSGVIKNAIDWASRPYGEGVIKGKPVAVLSASFNPEYGPKTLEQAQVAAKIAGAEVIADHKLFIPIGELPEGGPAADPQIVNGVKAVLSGLAAAVKA